LADRGFGRAAFLAWLQEQGLDYVVRITAGTGLVTADGSRWRLGTEGLRPGEMRWEPNVRSGQRYQGRPHDLWINVALCWRLPRHVQSRHPPNLATEPWYLATNQPSAQQAVAWYRQRFWIEESFKDSKSRFQLKRVRIGSPERFTRLLLALTIALCWLALAALPESSALHQDGIRRSLNGVAPAFSALGLLCSTLSTISRFRGWQTSRKRAPLDDPIYSTLTIFAKTDGSDLDSSRYAGNVS
jgi:hypothetical protein